MNITLPSILTPGAHFDVGPTGEIHKYGPGGQKEIWCVKQAGYWYDPVYRIDWPRVLVWYLQHHEAVITQAARRWEWDAEEQHWHLINYGETR